MRLMTILALLLFSCGCTDKDELQKINDELFNQKKEVLRISNQLASQQGESKAAVKSLEAKIQELTNTNASLVDQLARAKKELADVTGQFEKLKNALSQRRQAAITAQQEEQKRRDNMLKQAKEASRPDEYPFRLYSVMFVGKWQVNGVTAEHGKFSIRNYTDQSLEGIAIAGRPDGNNSYIDPRSSQVIWRVPTVRVSIPPESSKENIYIQANKDSRIIIQSNIGNKSASWGETK